MAMTARQIEAEFPETMSSIMLMKALGISGRKMRFILEQGYIPHTCNNLKTHRYVIARDDVIAYVKDSRAHPNKYAIPIGCFSSRNPKPGTKQKITETTHDPVVLQKYLRNKWARKSRLMTLTEAAGLLGYTAGTLYDWCAEGLLDAFSVGGKRMVTKEELIHCVALRKMQLRPGHSDKHKKLMNGYSKWLEKM